jgi:hypothetical protein
MKRLIIVFVASISIHYVSAQPTKITLKENGMKNALEWFVKTKTEELNSLPIEKKKDVSLNQIGVVTIEFYNTPDSIEYRDTPQSTTTELWVRHKVSTFKVFISPKFYVVKFPPTFYVDYDGVVVAIYTGVEEFIDFKNDEINSFDKKYVSKEKLIKLDVMVSEYIMKLDETVSGGFRIIKTTG